MSIEKIGRKIKNLKTKIVDLVNRKARLEAEIAQANLLLSVAEKDLLNASQCSNEINVSDHAFIRYLERHCQYPIAQLKEQLADKIRPFIGAAVDGEFTVEGIKFKVTNRTITTIL